MSTLGRRIAERIRRDGPITFADFMKAALYDPDDGFYAQPPVGVHGDFVTSPHVSVGFAELLCLQLEGMWHSLGTPDVFDVVEVGAGDGTLARGILDTAQQHLGFHRALRYRAVEISAGARAALSALGIPAHESLAAAGRLGSGCILANELLDNLPFHVLRRSDGHVVEVLVDAADDGTLVEREGEPTVHAPIEDGQQRAVSPEQVSFMLEAAKALQRGWVLTYDYGFAAGETPSPIRGYEGHRLRTDVLTRPGSADVTAGADFGAIADAANASGLQTFGPTTQRDVLRALGFDRWYAMLRERRLGAEVARDTQQILRLVSEQSRAPLLIDPAHLGAFKVFAIGVGAVGAPPGF